MALETPPGPPDPLQVALWPDGRGGWAVLPSSRSQGSRRRGTGRRGPAGPSAGNTSAERISLWTEEEGGQQGRRGAPSFYPESPTCWGEWAPRLLPGAPPAWVCSTWTEPPPAAPHSVLSSPRQGQHACWRVACLPRRDVHPRTGLAAGARPRPSLPRRRPVHTYRSPR